jgi:voltage-gated potassium channel
MLLVGGTLGYMWLEGMVPIEALYMTVITITTVGFGEIRPLSPLGRLFTIGLIVLGVGAATAAISNAVEVVLGQRLWLSVQKRRVEELLVIIKNHYIVCGYGRMGQQIVRDLQARGEPFLVIDSSPDVEETFLEERIPYIIGDATQDEVLLQAKVEQARGLVAALDTDADNVLTVLTARGLNPNLFIVARATSGAAESKLRRAGANRVVSPYEIGGHRMALALLRPAVHDFLNQIFYVGEGVADVDIYRLEAEHDDDA